MKEYIYDSLIQWYDQSKRILPWRDNPNPYHVWISEIMLQQTRVETVIPYFNRFIQELPTIEDLSKADDDKLNKLWEGLGYYSRVRNLKKAAIKVVDDFNGVLPSTQKELESLPGIGPYTSGAVLSIAFNKKYSAVDGNVLRVFSRLLEIRDNIKDVAVKKRIKSYVESILPDQRIGDFNQGLMEIGATVCLPNGKPICSTCPFSKVCKAYNNKVVDIIPVKQVKKKQRIEDVTVFVLQYQNLYAIEKRPDKGLLASLYQYPNIYGHPDIEEVKKLYSTEQVEELQSGKHVFSHIIWQLKGYSVKVDEKLDDYIWVTKEDIINQYSIPTAFKLYTKHILK